MIAPALNEIAGAMSGQVESREASCRSRLWMLFKNGELAWGQIGGAPKRNLEQWITALV